MHSFIIHSTGQAARENLLVSFLSKRLSLNLQGEPRSALTNFPDVFPIDSATTIGIEEIRKLKSHLALRPLSLPSKVALIFNAHKLTLEAQNSLLKTLEEPSPHTLIILELANPDQLLPTIVSRCELISPKPNKSPTGTDEKVKSAVKQALTSSPGKRLNLAREITSKEQALDFFQSLTEMFREITRNNSATYPILKSAIKAHSSLKSNCNFRLVMENYFLNLKIGKP